MGRPQFQQVITQVAEKTVKNYEVKKETIVAGSFGHEKVYFYSSPNTMSRVVAMDVNIEAPIGASGGTHYLDAYPDFNSALKYISASTSGANGFQITANQWDTPGNYEKAITDNAAMMSMVQNIIYTEDVPLVFDYTNNTGTANDTARFYSLIVVETQIR